MSDFSIRGALALLPVLGLIACQPEIDPATPLNELSSADVRMLCESWSADASSAAAAYDDRTITCTGVGLFSASDEAGCIAARDACLAAEAPPPESDPPDALGCEGATAFSEACTATVGELSACSQAIASDLEARIALYDCANAGDAEVRAALLSFALPSACEGFTSCTEADAGLPPEG